MRRVVTTTVLALVLTALPAGAKVFTVNPGGSIQAAVSLASPGDLVRVEPGTYHEPGTPCPQNASATCAVVITKSNIRLRGLTQHGAGVVLENPGGQDQGIAVAKPGADGGTCLGDDSQRIRGLDVSGFTVKGFKGEGIFLFCVDDYRITANTAADNAEYGIFPSHCGRGRVSHNVATGSNDTGIYIGQSHDVRIDRNTAMGNVSGFEIENSSNVRLDHNIATGNTGGILSFTLPFLDVNSNHDNLIDKNTVNANNKANSCLNPSDAVCAVPQGTGILLVATDRNTVTRNTTTNNNTFGVAVSNFCLGTGLDPIICALLDIEPNPDDNRIDNNVATGNGSSPDPLVPAVFAVDLAWDTTGVANCWKDNTNATQFPPLLPTCP